MKPSLPEIFFQILELWTLWEQRRKEAQLEQPKPEQKPPENIDWHPRQNWDYQFIPDDSALEEGIAKVPDYNQAPELPKTQPKPLVAVIYPTFSIPDRPVSPTLTADVPLIIEAPAIKTQITPTTTQKVKTLSGRTVY